MLIYRITKSKHASDISGTGAALFPGRWNKKANPVLYTAETIDIALLEIVVHTPPLLIPELDLLTIQIPDNSIIQYSVKDLPENWFHYPAPTILSEIGQSWIDDGKYLALKVPSSIIHTSHIILLNCKHKNYKKVKIIKQQNFYFDTRLKK